MFQRKSGAGYTQPVSGIRQKTIVYGEKTLMTEFLLDRGAVLPRHSHPHEQTGYLVKGEMMLSIGDDTYNVKPGDGWSIPGGVEHSAEIIDNSIAVEVFSPVREDYLPER